MTEFRLPPHEYSAVYRQNFMTLHQAGVGVSLCRSREPFRAIETLRDFAFAEQLDFKVWTVTNGCATHDRNNPESEPTCDNMAEPFAALKAINGGAGQTGFANGVYVMMYPHHFLPKHPGMMQVIKEYARYFAECKKRLVLLTPLGFTLPQELEDDVVLLDFDTPSYSEVGAIYTRLVSSIRDESRRPRFTPEDQQRLTAHGAGMTSHEYENALARALVTNRVKLPNIPVDDFADVILKVKTEVVKRSNVLEMMETQNMGEIGGLDNLKEWIRKRKKAFSEEAAEFGVEASKGIALIGPPGCLDGSNVLNVRRGKRNSGRPIRLDEFYAKFNGIPVRRNRRYAEDLPAFVHSFEPDTQRVFYNQVLSITEAGVRPRLRLLTETGEKAIVTPDHPILLEEGQFVAAEDLQPSSRLLVRGTMRPRPHERKQGRKSRVLVEEGLTFYSSGWRKEIYDPEIDRVYSYKRQHRAVLVMEAEMNSLTYADYLHRLNTDPGSSGLLTVPSGYVVHYKDHDPTNDTLSNLEVIRKTEHDRDHNDQTKFNVEYTRVAVVDHIEPLGHEMTYDVRMAEPAQNLVINERIIVLGAGMCS